MEMKIEKGIPLPDANPNRGGHRKSRPTYNNYRFEDMEVGDSFLCTNRTAGQLSTSAREWARRRGNTHVFVTRQLPEGVRVWRVK